MVEKVVSVKLSPECLTPLIDYVETLPEASKAKHNVIYVVNGDTKKGFALNDNGTFTAIDLYPMDYNITSSDSSVTVTKTVEGDVVTFDVKAREVITKNEVTTIIKEQQSYNKDLTTYLGEFQSPARANNSTNTGYHTLTYNKASGLGILHLDFVCSTAIPVEGGTIIFTLPSGSPTPKNLIETMFYTGAGYSRIWIEKDSLSVACGNIPANTRIIVDLFGFWNDND